MAIVLFNPTDEELRTQYSGIDVVIPAGGKLRVDDQKARHVLNVLGPRGLTTLEYGDDEKIEAQKAKDGCTRALDFKKKQIRTYNRENEGRKMRNLEYAEPPEQIKSWAKDLGIVLIQPYELPSVNMEEMSTLRTANKELMKTNEEVMAKFAEVMNMLDQKGLLKPEEDPHKELKEVFEHMRRDKFEPWVRDLTFDKFSKYPLEVQKDVMAKWEGFWNPEEKSFPY